MAEVLTRLAGPAALAAGTQTVFTGVAGHVYTNLELRIVNPTASVITVAVGINGVADADLVIAEVSLGEGDMVDDTSRHVLSGVDTLQVVASDAGLTLTFSGVDQS